MENASPTVKRVPDTAELSQWPKDWSFQLIKIVMEEVAAFDEVGGFWFDSELNFARDSIVEADVHQNVVGAASQPILYSYDL